MDTIGMVWDLSGARWDAGFAAAAAYTAREGGLKPPREHREDGIRLYLWVAQQRRMRRQGSLSAERIHRLESIGMIW